MSTHHPSNVQFCIDCLEASSDIECARFFVLPAVVGVESICTCQMLSSFSMIDSDRYDGVSSCNSESNALNT